MFIFDFDSEIRNATLFHFLRLKSRFPKFPQWTTGEIMISDVLPSISQCFYCRRWSRPEVPWSNSNRNGETIWTCWRLITSYIMAEIFWRAHPETIRKLRNKTENENTSCNDWNRACYRKAASPVITDPNHWPRSHKLYRCIMPILAHVGWTRLSPSPARTLSHAA